MGRLIITASGDDSRVCAVCRCRTTHWKQTVLYLEDTIVICQGESLSGAALVPMHSRPAAPLMSAPPKVHRGLCTDTRTYGLNKIGVIACCSACMCILSWGAGSQRMKPWKSNAEARC